MRIGIVDVDSKMVNIALMKISAFHKKIGDHVEWYHPILSGKLDRVYVSKIFNFSDDDLYLPTNCEIIKGGTGYDITSKLPEEIENEIDIDYTIYPKCDYSMQFFSRGCIRNCPFCVVRQKEGYIYPVKPMELNPKGKHIEVLDNNFFANPNWREAAEQLLKLKQPVNFHGIDARIMTQEHAYYLNKIKRYKQIHIAWDDPRENLLPKLKDIIKYIKPYKIMCYVLIGFWSTPEEDFYRVTKLNELGISPFVMPYDKANRYQKNFARWVNHKAVFKSVRWEDYKKAN
ncbi:hypothetical protein AN1V17_41880 [Vallitalea sediminicola]